MGYKEAIDFILEQNAGLLYEMHWHVGHRANVDTTVI